MKYTGLLLLALSFNVVAGEVGAHNPQSALPTANIDVAATTAETGASIGLATQPYAVMVSDKAVHALEAQIATLDAHVGDALETLVSDKLNVQLNGKYRQPLMLTSEFY